MSACFRGWTCSEWNWKLSQIAHKSLKAKKSEGVNENLLIKRRMNFEISFYVIDMASIFNFLNETLLSAATLQQLMKYLFTQGFLGREGTTDQPFYEFILHGQVEFQRLLEDFRKSLKDCCTSSFSWLLSKQSNGLSHTYRVLGIYSFWKVLSTIIFLMPNYPNAFMVAQYFLHNFSEFGQFSKLLAKSRTRNRILTLTMPNKWSKKVTDPIHRFIEI